MHLNQIMKENNIKNIKKWLILFAFTIGYKFILDYSYISILGNKVDEFVLDVCGWKVLLSTVIIINIFIRVDQFKREPSILLFNLFFYVTIIPISVIYGCCNMNSAYYFIIIIGTSICLMIINKSHIAEINRVNSIKESGVIIPYIGIFTVGILLCVMLYHFGLPSTDAFNFSKVYDIRLHGDYIDNKIFNYLFNWSTAVILPMLIARELTLKRHFFVFIYIAVTVIFYLYTASKAIIFMIPVIVGIYFLSKTKQVNYWFTLIFNAGIIGVSLLALTDKYLLYSYFVRRAMLLPAYLKFLYYDFFTIHDKIGLAGTLWGSAAGYPFPYENGLGVEISKYFFNNDIMNSNTGFLAEGYYRGGYIGVLCVMALFAVILKQVDRLTERTSLSFALSFSFYPIYSLNDSSIIDSIIFGPMLIFVLIILLYSDRRMSGGVNGKKLTIKIQQINLHNRYNRRTAK
ncbi:MAG: hypothetical protein SO251_00790 [Candidatus Fimisoma sp.]|nr:hypothetical protein [Candidatus Fimisoma sp.]